MEQYQSIIHHALFNLKPEFCSPYIGEFCPDTPIEIQVILKPDYLPDLTPYATSPEAAANYLFTLSQTNPDHPLLYTENWLALSVTQQQADREVGYTTLWNTLNPAEIAAGTITEAELSQGITQFFSNWTEANLGTITETATSQILTEVGNLFNEFADTSLEAIGQIATPETLMEVVLQFFTEDDWEFTKLKGEPILGLTFQGDNGTWNCYAKVRETEEQVMFYSICPIVPPEAKHNAIAEFLTRANYGLTIGNFEMDLDDGEIRYKTSIDVEGDHLTTALIQRLVYTNVATMDEYLPGIRAIIETDIPPKAAIATIETNAVETNTIETNTVETNSITAP